MHYSLATHTLTASLEVPGVRRENVRVTLGTCYFNWVKYVCVVAESEPVFGGASGVYEMGARAAGLERGGEKENVADVEAGKEGKSERDGEGKEEEEGESIPAAAQGGSGRRTSFGIPKLPRSALTGVVGRLVNPNLRERSLVKQLGMYVDEPAFLFLDTFSFCMFGTPHRLRLTCSLYLLPPLAALSLPPSSCSRSWYHLITPICRLLFSIPVPFALCRSIFLLLFPLSHSCILFHIIVPAHHGHPAL
ncbi:hypothetical protein BDZ97DRAFT_1791698 [Flammula alnicola]|nr:hypothetical protein BDZ97DRAFT_1791698 [Flammula alnicola]